MHGKRPSRHSPQMLAVAPVDLSDGVVFHTTRSRCVQCQKDFQPEVVNEVLVVTQLYGSSLAHRPGPDSRDLVGLPVQAVAGRGKRFDEALTASGLPFQRSGRKEKAAGLILYLASAQASYVTGQCIAVGGGLNTGI